MPTNTHNPKVVNMRSIGAQEPALRRRTELWGAVGNLSEDGDLWLHENTEFQRVPAARGGGARTTITITITSSELLSRSVCAVARGGGSALDPAARAPSSDVD